MNKNTILISIFSVIAIFGLLAIVYMATNSGNSTPTDSSFASNTVYPQVKTILPTDHTKWSKAQKHILTEYADLQCPACQQAYLYMKSNVDNDKTITDNITYVYRHFPLQQHKNSKVVAYAAEAAGKQGKFYEFVDVAFTTQRDWENLENAKAKEYFENVAKELKLNVEQFKADENDNNLHKVVDDSYNTGLVVDVNSTPTFYLDGKKVNVDTFDNFKALLEKTAKEGGTSTSTDKTATPSANP
jgi:protein-disulfide isomerase